MKTIGGTASPKVVPPAEETCESHFGGTPVTKPRFHARTAPVTIALTARVRTSAGTR